MNKTQSYNYYKKCEMEARVAAMNGNYIQAEELFLTAAECRLDYRDKFYKGKWDAGHKARYDSCVGAAWIQRAQYETELLEEQICYERNTVKPTTKWSVWRYQTTQNNIENFESLIDQHKKTKKRLRKKRKG